MDWTSFLLGNTSRKFSEFEFPSLFGIFALWKCSDDFQLGMVPSPMMCPTSKNPHDVPVFTRATSMDLYLFKSNLRKTSVGNGAACNTTSPRNPVVATELRVFNSKWVNLAWKKYIGSPQKKTSPGTFLKSGSITPLLGGLNLKFYIPCKVIDQFFEEPCSKFFDCRVAPVQCESYTQETANYPSACLDFQKRSVY